MKSSSRSPVLRRKSSIQTFLAKPLRQALSRNLPPQTASHLPPILRVPSELFIYILELSQEPELSKYSSLSGRSNWNRLSLVCRTWRALILQTRSLWCSIEFTSPRWTRLMLERSADASIDVSYSASESVSDPVYADIENMRLVLDNLHRTRRLSLFGAAVGFLFRDAGTLHTVLSLEALSLHAFAFEPWRYDVPEDLFATAGRLRDVELAGIVIPPSSSLFRANLIRLSLDRWEIAPAQGYTLGEMTDILKSMPLLESLSLNSWISNYAVGDSDAEPDVILPQLRSLTSTGRTTLECAIFVRRLSLPQTTHICLNCACRSLKEVVLPFSYLLKQRLGGSEPLPLTTIRVHYNGMRLAITGSPSIDKHPAAPGAFELAIRTPAIDPARSGLAIAQLISPLAFHSVTFLILDVDGLPADWAPTFAVLHTVEKIEVVGCNGHVVARLLCTPMNRVGHAVAQDVQMPCPHLHRLHFMHPKHIKVNPLFFDVLATVLDKRRTAGAPVEDVIIQGEPVTPEELRSLEVMKARKIWEFVGK